MSDDVVALNQQNVSVSLRVLDSTTGAAKTDITSASAGLEIWYQRDANTAVVDDAAAANDLTLITSAHNDWGLKHANDGWYRVDFPDAAFLEGASKVKCGLKATGAQDVSITIEIDPLLKYKGQASSVTAITTTFPAGVKVYKGDIIYVNDGTGIGQTRLVESVSGQEATHLAWTVNISATTSTIMLLPGDPTIADGGINVDALVSSRSTLSTSDIQSELTSYDAPTRAELTSDIDSVLARLPAALSAGGNIKADVLEINDTTVLGTGVSGDKWRGS